MNTEDPDILKGTDHFIHCVQQLIQGGYVLITRDDQRILNEPDQEWIMNQVEKSENKFRLVVDMSNNDKMSSITRQTTRAHLMLFKEGSVRLKIIQRMNNSECVFTPDLPEDVQSILDSFTNAT